MSAVARVTVTTKYISHTSVRATNVDMCECYDLAGKEILRATEEPFGAEWPPAPLHGNLRISDVQSYLWAPLRCKFEILRYV